MTAFGSFSSAPSQHGNGHFYSADADRRDPIRSQMSRSGMKPCDPIKSPRRRVFGAMRRRLARATPTSPTAIPPDFLQPLHLICDGKLCCHAAWAALVAAREAGAPACRIRAASDLHPVCRSVSAPPSRLAFLPRAAAPETALAGKSRAKSVCRPDNTATECSLFDSNSDADGCWNSGRSQRMWPPGFPGN